MSISHPLLWVYVLTISLYTDFIFNLICGPCHKNILVRLQSPVMWLGTNFIINFNSKYLWRRIINSSLFILSVFWERKSSQKLWEAMRCNIFICWRFVWVPLKIATYLLIMLLSLSLSFLSNQNRKTSCWGLACRPAGFEMKLLFFDHLTIRRSRYKYIEAGLRIISLIRMIAICTIHVQSWHIQDETLSSS